MTRIKNRHIIRLSSINNILCIEAGIGPDWGQQALTIELLGFHFDINLITIFEIRAWIVGFSMTIDTYAIANRRKS
jgi:hypothetical protein